MQRRTLTKYSFHLRKNDGLFLTYSHFCIFRLQNLCHHNEDDEG